jgi:nitroimidazol reductase NimA-like FMN-containing flavoprotein (pyridoxamine 5'-phosphate oxidase superfamily)
VASKQTQEILDQLAGIRRRIDELSEHWEVNHDVAIVIRGLDELSASVSSAAYPSIEALLFGAARLIERGEPAGERLERLSDHLHGYTVGWEDAAEAGAS